ncbi:MAG: lipopolysaccharide kinase [Kangiellaceae bacterium]|nr:lipopolysaccharide kinase [Kangiellaceae bacterium]|tara:strand:- start:7471 stop:8658 length:1188 start_codon:yes stop_codon:yes gene_type:complete
MKFQISSPQRYPSNPQYPWEKPLAMWEDRMIVNVPRGISRNLVRFIEDEGCVYAVKEIPDKVALREYDLLKELNELELPVVQPVGVLTERHWEGESIKALLVTRFLKFALPFRTLISGGFFAAQQERLLDALVDLIVRLHLAGFYWGDCSLSNTLFRLDAGRFAAYLVDAETGEIHPTLSKGQREYDLELAEQNIAGELMDLAAGFGLPDGVDPIDTAQELVARYHRLWGELTDDEVFARTENYRIEARINRLNQLGFDVEELELETVEGGHRLRMKPKVVESGHHTKLLQSLTGLVVQENQARRLLNDIHRYRVWLEGEGKVAGSDSVMAFRWYTDVYLAALEAIPSDFRKTLDDPEIFHQLLEHRWFLSEAAGQDVGLSETITSYVKNVLSKK